MPGLFDDFYNHTGRVHPVLANLILVVLEGETSGARGITGSRAVTDLVLTEEAQADANDIVTVLNGKASLLQKFLYAKVVESAAIKVERGTYDELEFRRDAEIGVTIVPPHRGLIMGFQTPIAAAS